MSKTLTTQESYDWDSSALGLKSTVTTLDKNHISAPVGFEVLSNANGGGPVAASGIVVQKSTRSLQSFPQDLRFAVVTGETGSYQDTSGNFYNYETPGNSIATVPRSMNYESHQGRYTKTITGLAEKLVVDTPWLNGLLQSATVSYEGLSGGNTLSGNVGAAYGYDSNGNLIRISPQGVNWSVQQGHDPFGRVTSSKDPSSLETRYEFDRSGRIRWVYPSGGETPIEYIYNDSDHRGVTIRRGMQETTHRFNGFGEQILTIRKNNQAGVSHRAAGYDAKGRNIWETGWRNGLGSDSGWAGATPPASADSPRSTRYTYDGLGRVTQLVNLNNEVVSTTYSTTPNGRGNTWKTIATGQGISSSTFEFDLAGRLVYLADAMNHVTEYRYEESGKVSKVIQWRGAPGSSSSQVRTWCYDEHGRLKILVQPETGLTTYSRFDVNGKPWVTDYNGRAVYSYFDAQGHVTSVSSPDGTVNQSFSWGTQADRFANKLKVATVPGVTRSLDYDPHTGRLSTLTRSVDALPSFVQTFGYDTYGNRTTATMDGRKVDTSFDASMGLPRTVKYQNSDIATATYNATAWNLIQLGYVSGGTTSFFTYDDDQTRLRSMTHAMPGLTKGWTYYYDPAGRMTTDGEDTYVYDPLGRLKTAATADPYGTNGLFQTFDYDAFGNRIFSKTETAMNWVPPSAFPGTVSPSPTLRPGLNQVTANASFNSSDATFLKNQMPAFMSNGAGTGAHYDTQGNLDRVYTTPSDSSTQVSMTYDALARVSTCLDSKRGVTEKYRYDDEGLRTVIEEWQGETLLKRRYNIYNDSRQLVSQYEEAPHGGIVEAGAIQTLRISSASNNRISRRAATSARVPTDPVEKEPCGADITSPSGNISVQVGQNIAFTGVTDLGTSASWTFGDGGTATGFNVTRAYSTTGIFTVRLIVKGPSAYTLPSSATRVITVSPAVNIGSFTTTASTIPIGGSATLNWSTSGATSVTLNGTGVGAASSQIVSPTATTTYTLTAASGATTVSQQITISVVQAPLISYFSASPSNIYQGDSTALGWNVTNATTVSLDQGIGGVSGISQNVSPSGTTTYTLTASNSQNGVSVTRTASATVIVSPRPTVPSITSFYADAGSIGAGNGTTLRWTVANSVGAVNVTLASVGTVSASGTQWVVPSTTTTYTITATNSLDASKTVSANVTVSVIQKPVITGFSASPGNVFLGGQTTLNWAITNSPTSVNIDNGVGVVGASGSTVVSLNANQTYTITASNLGGTATAQVLVTVTPKPSITNFAASFYAITKGRSSTLVWNVQGANGYTINGTPISGTSVVVAPSATTNYTLRASNGSGYTELALTVTVQDTGTFSWKKDIVYMGTKEIAEISSDGKTSITMTDHLGSPRFMWDGTTLTPQKFLPFGEQLTAPDGMNKFAKGFTNHEQTDASGLIYMQARFYLPMWGRFASPDPARDQHFEQTQSWNIYSYVQNSPVMKIDPTGMWDGDVHTQLTAMLAYAAGADPKMAANIGNATQRLDRESNALSGGVKRIGVGILGEFAGLRGSLAKQDALRRQEAEPHFPEQSTIDGYTAKFNSEMNVANLGDFIHVSQDAIGHGDFINEKHHASSPRADRTDLNPGKAWSTVEKTYSILVSSLDKMGLKTGSTLSLDAIRSELTSFLGTKNGSKERTVAQDNLWKRIYELQKPTQEATK
ncbi:MAG: RHS repeat-associated core domain-containing protein [Rectinemataceae bacterium]|nr:RHS repeat-associated core domain-containing protein [Rectinemataceae bacterium]